MTSFKDFPNPRDHDYFGKNSRQKMFDADGYMNAIEKWKEKLETELQTELGEAKKHVKFYGFVEDCRVPLLERILGTVTGQ